MAPAAATRAAPAAVVRAWSIQSVESGIQASGLAGKVRTPWPESELATWSGASCLTSAWTQFPPDPGCSALYLAATLSAAGAIWGAAATVSTSLEHAPADACRPGEHALAAAAIPITRTPAMAAGPRLPRRAPRQPAVPPQRHIHGPFRQSRAINIGAGWCIDQGPPAVPGQGWARQLLCVPLLCVPAEHPKTGQTVQAHHNWTRGVAETGDHHRERSLSKRRPGLRPGARARTVKPSGARGKPGALLARIGGLRPGMNPVNCHLAEPKPDAGRPRNVMCMARGRPGHDMGISRARRAADIDALAPGNNGRAGPGRWSWRLR